MNKIAIVTDSNSGITQEQAKQLGIHVIPMPFVIDQETYYEDISLTTQQFYKKLEQNVDISTSQPSLEEVTSLWDELLKAHESIVHIPMSSGLSGACATAHMLAQDYEGRVQVVNNQRISVTQRQSVLDALELVKQGKNAEEICSILEEVKLESSIYIMLDTLKYLKKGGRITPAAAALGTILKLKPVLQIQGEKLDAFAKARTAKQGVGLMLQALQDDIEMRFGGEKQVRIQVAHSDNEEAALALKEEVQGLFPEHDIYIDQLSLSVSCHIGPGALAVACTKNL